MEVKAVNLTDQQRISKTVERLNYDPEEIARAERRKRAEQIPSDLRYSIEQSLARRVRMERVKAA